MSKVIVPGWYHSSTHNVRCARCSCVFEYTDKDVYEKMEVPRRGATSNPYGYIRLVVDCPECGWQAPAIKMAD